MGLFNKKSNRALQKEPQSKLYRTVMNSSIIAVFLAIGILVFSITGIIKFTSFMFGLIATIAILAIAGILLLPWIRNFEKQEYKKLSIIFMIFIGICAILWIISIYLGISIYNQAKTDSASDAQMLNTLKFIKVVLIISLQFLVSSLVASTIIKYKKKMVAFQAITYASNLFFDFYLTYFLICITITSEGISISEGVSLLGNKLILTFFIISIIFIAISSKIMQVVEERRYRNAVEDNYNIHGESKLEKNSQNAKNNSSVEEKLNKLKSMYEKELITQDEYEAKKADILKDL